MIFQVKEDKLEQIFYIRRLILFLFFHSSEAPEMRLGKSGITWLENNSMKNLDLTRLSQKELGYLIGLFDGDGYSNIHSGHYKIEFYLNSLKDQDIRDQLLDVLKKINLKPRVIKDKRFNCIKIEIVCKLFFKVILGFSNNNPKSKNFKLGYISGIIDSEGYVNRIKRFIQIINTDEKLMKKVQNYLKTLNIDSRITKKSKCRKDKLQRYSLYVPVKFLNTKNISMKIKRPIAGLGFEPRTFPA
jgi:intein/homing endonuclease